MKQRLLTIFLIGLLITGCSKNENDNNFSNLKENETLEYTQGTEDKEVKFDEGIKSDEEAVSEEYMVGHTSNYLKIFAPKEDEYIKKSVLVKVNKVDNNGIFGEICHFMKKNEKK